MKRRKSEQGTPSYDREFKQTLESLITITAFQHVRPERLKFFAHVLTQLHNVSAGGGQWTACCPAHADSSPSLSVTLNPKGDVLVNCFRGCSFADICRELNLMEYEMYDNSCASEPIRPLTTRRHIISPVNPADPKWMSVHTVLVGAITAGQVDVLASHLKVSAEALTALEVGWSTQDLAWTFPERNGHNEVCGILRRYPDDQKLMVKGGKRGLSLPAGWREKQSTLYICEGQSDTAAALSAGYRAIGRPGKSAGLKDLICVLSDVDEEIIVVLDNDPERTGDSDTGFSARLADGIRRTVGEYRPPREFKDLREYLTRGDQR